MKWHQLTEDTNIDENNVWEFIQKNCQPYLRENPEWKEISLYRGADNHRDCFIGNIKQNRLPRDTNQFLHSIYDETLKNAGFIASRSNSIFCTGNQDVAEGYGNLYVIFPIGFFEYTWSETYPDLTYEIGNIAKNGGIVFKNVDDAVLTIDDLGISISELRDIKIPTIFSFNYMKNVILKEIGKSYADWLRTIDYSRVFKKLELDRDNLVKHFKEHYRNDNILLGIESHSEIMISGKSYLAIRDELYIRAVKNWK